MVFDATRRFLRRNRTNIFVGAGIAATGYLAVNYITSKITDAKSRMQSERVARENIHRRFQQNQEDCTFTVLALLPTLSTHLHTLYPTETHTSTLQQKKALRLSRRRSIATDTSAADSEPSVSIISLPSVSTAPLPSVHTKAELWDLIKHTSLTRTFTSLYTLPLLTLLTRIQLNLLGRRNYLHSVLTLASAPESKTITLTTADAEENNKTNQAYLTFSWWLLHRGYALLGARVEEAVKAEFADINPRDTINLSSFRRKCAGVRERVEDGLKLLPLLLPGPDGEAEVLAEGGQAGVSDAVRRLLDETSDLVESPGAWTVWENMVTAGFEMLVEERLAGGVFGGLGREGREKEGVGKQGRFELVEDDAEAKVASLLAAIAREAKEVGRAEGNEYLKAIESTTELEAFAALVYSSNFEFAAQLEEPKA